jgi:MOB kinase activator 1
LRQTQLDNRNKSGASSGRQLDNRNKYGASSVRQEDNRNKYGDSPVRQQVQVRCQSGETTGTSTVPVRWTMGIMCSKEGGAKSAVSERVGPGTPIRTYRAAGRSRDDTITSPPQIVRHPLNGPFVTRPTTGRDTSLDTTIDTTLSKEETLYNSSGSNERTSSTRSVDSVDLVSPLHVQYGAPTMRTHVREYGIRMGIEEEGKKENTFLYEGTFTVQETSSVEKIEEKTTTAANEWKSMMPRSSTTTPTNDVVPTLVTTRKRRVTNTPPPPPPSSSPSSSSSTTTTAKFSKSPSYRIHTTFDRKHAYIPTLRHSCGSIREYIHRKYLSQVTLGRIHPSLSLKECVHLPPTNNRGRGGSTIDCKMNREHWIATHVLDFFNEISIVFGTIHAGNKCNAETCPCMSAGPRYTYKWADGNVVTTPIKLPASEYIRLLLEWVKEQILNTTLFPTLNSLDAVPQQPEFNLTVNAIFKRLFRVYAHVYHSHYPYICSMNIDKSLNQMFGRFVWFVHEWNLVDERQLAPMKEVMKEIMDRSATKP